MRWLKAKRFYLKRQKTIDRPDKLVNPMKDSRFPYSYPYPYSYGDPYESGGGRGFSYTSDPGSGGKIKMDPEKYIGLGLGKGAP
jgi:hypothetical protein